MSRPRLSRRLAALAAAVGLLAGAGVAAAADPTPPRPLRVLVFSQPYGFSHTDSIVKGGAYLDALDGVDYIVDNTVDPKALYADNLAKYDVLVWNNSTGEVPLNAQQRRDLLSWVRAGHGFVGIHSAGDSNYTWPEFAELTGGFFLMHWYRFGGMTPEPYRLQLIKEDPSNPILGGVPASYDSYDETYAWNVDPRPDVHVLMSADNASIYAEGALYSWHQPLTWCRPFGGGRTFYTNLGHDGALWSDPVFTRLIRNGLQYAGGRLTADCSVPTDPATGVNGEDRMEAAWAQSSGATPTVSTYSGGMTVLTGLKPGATTVTYPAVDLGGVTKIDVFATAQTIGPMASSTTPQQRISPASGGTVEIHADSATGPLLGSVTIAPAPGLLATTNTPDQARPAGNAAMQAASWSKLTATLTPVTGVHDLVLTFPPGPVNTVLATASPDRNLVGSLAWIHLTQ